MFRSILQAAITPVAAAAVLVLAVPAIAATGGPDTFGYMWIDSLEPAGPVYVGHDISTSGTFTHNGDDTSSGPVTLGVPVDFYGTLYTQLVIASNGYLSTDPSDTGGDLSNDCPLPASPSSGGGGRLYILHDDLDLEPGTGSGFYEYFASCPRAADRGPNTGCSIFMWDDVSHYPGGGVATWDMWIYLYDNLDVVYEIGPGNSEQGSSSTTGIMNPAYTDALVVACETAGTIPDTYVVLFEHPAGGAFPTCTVTGPAGVVSREITVDGDIVSTSSSTVDLEFRFSTDGGVTLGLCTPAPASPLATNPTVGQPTGLVSFLWDSRTDNAGVAAVAVGVIVELYVDDGVGTNTCQTAPFDVDNTFLCQTVCGDCDDNTMGPTVLDALVGAQLAAALLTPTLTQTGCCDVDSSGTITVLDALLMAQAAAALPVTLTCP